MKDFNPTAKTTLVSESIAAGAHLARRMSWRIFTQIIVSLIVLTLFVMALPPIRDLVLKSTTLSHTLLTWESFFKRNGDSISFLFELAILVIFGDAVFFRFVRSRVDPTLEHAEECLNRLSGEQLSEANATIIGNIRELIEIVYRDSGFRLLFNTFRVLTLQKGIYDSARKYPLTLAQRGVVLFISSFPGGLRGFCFFLALIFLSFMKLMKIFVDAAVSLNAS